MPKTTLLFSLFALVLLPGCQREVEPPAGDDSVPAQYAAAIKKAGNSNTDWRYAKCMNWCWRNHEYCTKHQTHYIDCHHHLGHCIEACESEFDPQFGETPFPQEPVEPTEVVSVIAATAAASNDDTDAGYAKCVNWCFRSHTFCREHQSDEIDCDHHLGVCLDACEREYDYPDVPALGDPPLPLFRLEADL